MLGYCAISACFPSNDHIGSISIIEKATHANNTQVKLRALKVLQNKCNSCHLKKNRSVVFTAANMSQKAPEIYKQVFIKKRMPKGKVKLTETELVQLRLWLKEEKF